MNVVPTERTRIVAQAMVAAAVQETGPDAVLRHLPNVQPDQLPALIGLLLTNVRIQKRMGRTQIPDQFTEEERREGNRRWKKGHRDPETVARWREYQRIHQRQRTERVGRFGR